MKPPSPLLGFNNNVRHKGRVFHIQTEDSGVRHPHIITHLFADGGRILKTVKTSYAEFIDAANMGEVVRQMMQDQHKAMFMALRDGQFDSLLEEMQARGASSARLSGTGLPAGKASPELPVASKGPPPAASPPPAPPARPAVAPPPLPAAPVAKLAEPLAAKIPADVSPAGDPAPSQRSRQLAAPPLPTMPVVVPPAPPIAQVIVTSRDSAPPEPMAPTQRRPTPPRMQSARPRLDIDPAAIHRVPPPHSGPASSTLASVVEATVDATPGIDLDTLERAAKEAETPLFQQIHDLPPPPAAVLGARATGAAGGYSSVSAPNPATAPPPSTRGRYAPSRPSSIFSAARPQDGASIFGEDMISEKSLDEVILSYLAEDLDGPGEKK